LAVALREDDRGNWFSSGLALSICAYKPTLLLLLLPMLVTTKRWKTIQGFAAGLLASTLLVTATEGVAIWRGYIKMLFYFGSQWSTSAARLRLYYYVDLKSLMLASVPAAPEWAKASMLAVISVCVLALLIVAWRRGSRTKSVRVLLWSTTLSWSLLLNFYVSIFDSAMILIGMISMAALRDLVGRTLYRWSVLLSWLILAVSWMTVLLAQRTGVQIATILITFFASIQLAACLKRQPDVCPVQCESTERLQSMQPGHAEHDHRIPHHQRRGRSSDASSQLLCHMRLQAGRRLPHPTEREANLPGQTVE
jgi:hypothetical protein